jgi:hypothetical protein
MGITVNPTESIKEISGLAVLIELVSMLFLPNTFIRESFFITVSTLLPTGNKIPSGALKPIHFFTFEVLTDRLLLLTASWLEIVLFRNALDKPESIVIGVILLRYAGRVSVNSDESGV